MGKDNKREKSQLVLIWAGATAKKKKLSRKGTRNRLGSGKNKDTAWNITDTYTRNATNTLTCTLGAGVGVGLKIRQPLSPSTGLTPSSFSFCSQFPGVLCGLLLYYSKCFRLGPTLPHTTPQPPKPKAQVGWGYLRLPKAPVS